MDVECYVKPGENVAPFVWQGFYIAFLIPGIVPLAGWVWNIIMTAIFEP
jgi:hypothetical protein